MADLSTNMSILVQEMLFRGVSCRRIPGTILVEAIQGNSRYVLSQYTLPIIPAGYVKLLDNKIHFKMILRDKHIPYVLKSESFSSDDYIKALAYAKQLGFPVVCKPQYGMGMHLVYVRIANEEEFLSLWEKHYSTLKDNEIIVEPYFQQAVDYRLMIFKDGTKAAIAGYQPQIEGNEKDTVRDLVLQENKRRKQLQDGKMLAPLIMDDAEALRTLSSQGLTLESIPSKNTSVILRYGAHVNSGGISEVIDNEKVHPEYWTLVERVWSVFPKMPFFSLDILSRDIRLAPDETCTAINESHVGPNVIGFLNPTLGKPVNLYIKLVDLLFPPEIRASL